MAKSRKKKTRTVEDVIEDIRELHEKEEDLLMELEDLTQESDIDEGDE
jgi:predicted KAP-like P-loop ATPase